MAEKEIQGVSTRAVSIQAVSMQGTGTALVTPFTDGQVDTAALRALIELQIEGGIDFLVPTGTTGEAPTLTDDERILVIETTVDAAAGRVPVVAGTGTNDTPHSVAMTKAARKAGADACLAVSPYYNKPTQEGLYRHFRAMIDDGGLPAMLYHIVGRCGIPIEMETVVRTAAGGGVIGLKETESVGRVTRLRELCDVPIFSGDDGLTFPMIAMGAIGVVSVASNLVPDRIAELVRHARDGEMAAARACHDDLAPLFRALFREPNPCPVKSAMQIVGMLPSDDVRLPLVATSDSVRAELNSLLG